jgi:prephenate dehydrogenase
VLVTKDGGSVVVDVTDRDETVHVSTPIRAIESTIEQVAAASPDTHN